MLKIPVIQHPRYRGENLTTPDIIIKTPVLTNKGYFEDYGIDQYGGVYSSKSSGWNGNKSYWKKMIHRIKNRGYHEIAFIKNGKSHFFRVHRLVLMNFGVPKEIQFDLEVDHKDGNKDNNHISNLEWVTRSENEHRAHVLGLKTSNWKSHYGEDNCRCTTPNDVLFEILDELMKGELDDYAIARKYNRSQSFVSAVKLGRIRRRDVDKYLSEHGIVWLGETPNDYPWKGLRVGRIYHSSKQKE